MKTFNSLVGLRLIVKSEDKASVTKALQYLKQIRVYPLRKASASLQPHFIDMADTVWDTVPRFDESFYASLSRMVNEEPVQPRDSGMLETLRAVAA